MLEFVITADGSKTLYNAKVGENYHSKHGALQESEHVFLTSGLKYFLSGRTTQQLSVLEVGFGTGLNFLLTANHFTKNNIGLDYTGIEAYPLSVDMIAQTAYDEYVSEPIWKNFCEQYQSALNQTVNLNNTCRLHIAHTELLAFNSLQTFDVIYFDAFAALHQPEMWNEASIRHTISFLNPGGVFVTYAITGNLKRMLKAMGLTVEKVPGAKGKREMLRAVKPLN